MARAAVRVAKAGAGLIRAGLIWWAVAVPT
jgi:hypothetical protein